MFSWECCEFFKSSFFYRTLPVAVMSTRKIMRGKRGTKEQGKNFQMKEENENLSFNLYLQVLVLVKIKMQIQLCKYQNCSPFFCYFSLVWSFLWFLRVHFLCFHFWQTEKYILLHLLVYSEAGIKSCSVKQLFGKI